MLWMHSGPLNVRLSDMQIIEISIKLEDFMKILPDEFAKRSRPLKFYKYFLDYVNFFMMESIVLIL